MHVVSFFFLSSLILSKEYTHKIVTLLLAVGGLCSGTYLEMGGLNGIRFSNTYVFNKVLGWNGVLVELSPKNFAALQKNRPNEIANVHAGVCGEKKTLHYVEPEKDNVGGIWEFSSPSFRDQW